ncbi:transcriptional regulator with XRE-family HTH domain [Krasilnikovia cinnamomea]|uniref:Transcriptional regulator with XRE-family HTH domain n=1 Tax=Krasilnikovia cinnamomea TaxID=349313 RepID=A0A4Q7ZNM2_9ACTN|nr:helix-turn-helix transcriptional regulator [Krasilnikovia cinnamomea]RZU52642.1 transcriptional regulator with XRE-family HTH domain [Krasilnikovia cinnamomea]
MTAPVKQAREALGARLREVRRDAGLTGRALAERCNWHFTKISKLEHGTQTPSEADIGAWCRACGADAEIPDLVATMRAIESMYIEWQRHMRAGMKRAQSSAVPLYEKTKLFRGYENTVIPGLFHTAEYAASIFAWWADFLALPNDAEAAVAARMERQQVLYTGDRRFLFVLEEQVLHTRVGNTEVMLGQLDRLLAVISLPRVSVGIIPANGRRQCLSQGSFWIFDERLVQIETMSAGLEVTQPREIAIYGRAFALLQASAVFGRPARDLIGRAIADLPATTEAG